VARSGSSTDSATADHDVEKSRAVVQSHSQAPVSRQNRGLTFFVKKGAGFTKKLQAQTNLLTLVEGPYENNSTNQVLLCDRLLLIAGGIGITAIVPFVANHWNVKLSWSVRENAECLVNELAGVLDTVEEKDVRVGSRLDVPSLLAHEVAAGWHMIGVVISGPPSFCDDAKAAVIAQARVSKTTQFELEIEAYSW
jgi:predicted ferric reductase